MWCTCPCMWQYNKNNSTCGVTVKCGNTHIFMYLSLEVPHNY